MLVRLTLAVLLATTALTSLRAQPTLPATADGAGNSARGCIAFPRALDSDAEIHPGDFLTMTPGVLPVVSVAGGELCLDGLAYGTRYAVTVRPGLRFADGSQQAEAAQAVIETPDREPAVAVAGRGWILPRQGATGVTVQTINVPRVRIRVLRLSARELAASTPANRFQTKVEPRKQVFSLYDVQSLAQNEATEIWSGTMQANAGRNRAVETAFPLAGIVDPAKPGAYLVLAEDAAKPAAKLVREPNDRYDFAAKIAGHWVLNTDLAISSAQGQDGLHVTVRSLGSAAPLPWVKLQLLSLGQDVLGEAVTDAAGAAVFGSGLLRGKLGSAAAVLMARTDSGDMALQDLTAPAFDLSDRGAEGRVSPGPIEAYVYTDRGIYRPGEAVQVTALLRTKGLAAVDGAGLTLVLRRPDGVEANRFALPPAPDAGFVQPMALTKTAAQGSWTIEAYLDPSLPPVGRTTVTVQDFVPQTLKVAVTGPAALDGDAHLMGAIDGRFLYGAPGAGLHAEGDVRLVRDEHPVPGARDYSFGLPDEALPNAPQPIGLADADAVGHVAIDAMLPIPAGIASPLRAVVDAGLTEPGGRAVRQTLSIPIHNHPLLIGLRPLFGDRVDTGSPVDFAIRTFDAEGRPAARAGLQWRLVRQTPHWDWWRDQASGGGWTFHTYTTEDDVAQGAVDAPESVPATLSQRLDWGDYRLIVSDAASGAASSVRFSIGWGAGSANADMPDQLQVSNDRAAIGIGDTTHIHVRGPFAGPAQIIVESAGRVLETRRVDLPRDGATIDLRATAEWGAGVHVLAQAFRPLATPASAHDPVRAVGLAWIATDPTPHTLAVSITQPRTVSPRQAISVPVHVAGAHGRAFVTLAAVDEGILQLTHFVSPDPVAALLGRTRFGLNLRDDYGRLLDGHADIGALQEGGDEGAALGGQGLPVTTTRVVSLFHGPVELDANGNATIPLDLPDFAGELRLLAVAYDHDAAGHAEAALTVRDPVVAELALPRFLAPGDVAEIGVSLHDTDGPAGSYHLAVTATGAARLQGTGELDFTLAQGERREARLALAGAAVGTGHVMAVLTGPEGLRITHEWDITVRSPHPDLVLSQTGTQAPGEEYKPDAALLAAFVPGSAQLTIGYSGQANIDVPGLLQSLYTYPFGCTEQLSSSALPLLYFNDARLLGHAAGDPGVHARVQDAIDTIADRQDQTGRFGLWHIGDGAAPVWVNVYALDFLLRARETGFTVPDRVTSQSTQWIEQQLGREDADWDGIHGEPAQPTRAYAAYVLARTNRVDPASLRALANTLDRQKQDGTASEASWRRGGLATPLSLAQLGGAQTLMGARSSADASFALALGNLDNRATPDWWSNAYFWSKLRDEAGLLAMAVETGHDDVAATVLQRLATQTLQPDQMNTQEKAWLLMAAHALGKRGSTRTLSIDGGVPASVTLPYALSAPLDAVARGVSVRNAGADPMFRTVTVRGAPKDAPPAMSAGFAIRRDTYSLSGDKLDDAALRQTDRFLVVLSGAVADGVFRRAVVTDPLPAGLEIEAPVLRADQYPFIGQLTQTRAHEERDDRYIAAFDIGQEARRWTHVDDDQINPLEPMQFRVAYVVRAVTPGRFVRPETVVEDMYHPEVMARTAAAALTVAPR